jgi:phospholipid/cholesterol/gamma-HCH transport system permease protein
MLILTADILFWSINDLFDRRGQRQGSFTQQVNLIGINAIPIVALLSFIIGLILSLQSAVQLKNFGADQFLANLLAISLVREMSPLITAIIIAGRSGSAIASEIATMKVTEEIDALKMMALNPIRYVIVPKFHAVTTVMALLVTISIIVGILGGVIIAVVIGGQSSSAFVRACFNVVRAKDFILSMIKSTIFAWQIVIIGSHYGLQVEGGAEGVGKATTQSVVAAIFSVIIMDAIFSLIYLVN